jgi:3-dehydroquinate dehydratase-1
MNPVVVRGIRIGEGTPKICVPIVGQTKEEILEAAQNIRNTAVDVVEWRADWFDGVFDQEQVLDALTGLREALGDIPLLFTFRTAKEGGEKEISAELYQKLNLEAAKSGLVDLVDVELFIGIPEETLQAANESETKNSVAADLIQALHGCGVRVIASNHDFVKTPEREEILRRLRKMQELGADIPKIAVMPQSKQDVLTLLSATEEMASQYADRPIITMSMAKDGVISRLCGEIFGSALTFGAVGKTSAPGQVSVEDLKQILQLLHKVAGV